uniref:Uncharacterized protein n=1 Tax=Physcomitrium patens TaxID=3218 RepID=A0A2K1IX07_PHYPA|nr:hypothetical protein PHYPA_023629 [Physcomitrium patens]
MENLASAGGRGSDEHDQMIRERSELAKKGEHEDIAADRKDLATDVWRFIRNASLYGGFVQPGRIENEIDAQRASRAGVGKWLRHR